MLVPRATPAPRPPEGLLLEDAPDPPHRRPAGIEPDRDEVDPVGAGADTIGSRSHAAALLLGDLVGRILADPRLDLDGRNDAVDANEQVDLAAAGGEVPCDRPSPASDQEPDGNRLTDRP